MTVKVTILNGPPRSGKNTLADGVQDSNLRQLSFAAPIKNALKAFFNLTPEEFRKFDNELKDIVQERLFGMSWRQWCMKFSEEFIKPNLGKRVFGDLLTHNIEQLSKDEEFPVTEFIISDSGFDEEVKPLIEKFGKDSITIIKLKRDGCSFAGDTRFYLDSQGLGVNEVWIENSELDKFLEDGRILVDKILSEK